MEQSYNPSLSSIIIDVSDFRFAPRAWGFLLNWYQSFGYTQSFWVSQEAVQTFYQTCGGQLGFFED